MAQSKALSKGISKNKSIESTYSDNKSSGSTISDNVYSKTEPGDIPTTNNDASDNKNKSQSYEGLNLLFQFIHSLFIDFM